MRDENHERRPFAIGTVVGYQGQRVTIASWRPDHPYHVFVRMPDRQFKRVSIGELHVAPELDRVIHEASLIVSEHIGNQRAIFDQED